MPSWRFTDDDALQVDSDSDSESSSSSAIKIRPSAVPTCCSGLILCAFTTLYHLDFK